MYTVHVRHVPACIRYYEVDMQDTNTIFTHLCVYKLLPLAFPVYNVIFPKTYFAFSVNIEKNTP